MPRQRTETYLCDKCGDKCVAPKYPDMKRWWEMKSVMDSSSSDSWMLCRSCVDLFKEWVEVKDTRPTMTSVDGGPFR